MSEVRVRPPGRGGVERITAAPALAAADQAKGLVPFRLSRRARDTLTGYAFLAPWLIGLFAFTLGPIVGSLLLSFTNYNLLSSPHWIGLTNYADLLHDPDYLAAVRVTLVYVVVGVPLKLFFGLLVAMLLNKEIRAMRFYRSLYYIPSLLGGNVAIAILWTEVFGKPGLFDDILGVFHIQGPAWVDDPHTALSTLIVLELWQFGAPMIIFLAALKQVPKSLYDAAAVDGAGALRTFWRITVPLITPVIFFNLILEMIGSFQAFTPAFIISGGTGGPVNSTLFYTLYLYIEGFGNLQMGYASAMAWILLLVTAIVTALLFFTGRYWVFYQDTRR